MVAFLIPGNTAFDTWDALLAAVHSRLDRDDLSADFQTFVGLTEAMIQREIALTDFEASTSVAITSGTGALPTDLRILRRVILDECELAQLPVSVVDGIGYRIEAGQILITPIPDPDTTATLLYTARFSPLTHANRTNALLDTHPDLYFYGCLAHACDHIDDQALASSYMNLFLATLSQVGGYTSARKWGTAPRPRLPEHTVR